MRYSETIQLKDGRECILRNGTQADGEAVLEVFQLTHGETDFLLSYPDENSFDSQGEGEFLRKMEESDGGIELIAIVDGQVVGSAGFEPVGSKYKVRHRAEFGISVARAFWGLGIGRALTKACIRLAKEAGYTQLELDVVADNRNAVGLYESVGFREYGRNPRGFRSRETGWQELVLMRLELQSLDGERNISSS